MCANGGKDFVVATNFLSSLQTPARKPKLWPVILQLSPRSHFATLPCLAKYALFFLFFFCFLVGELRLLFADRGRDGVGRGCVEFEQVVDDVIHCLADIKVMFRDMRAHSHFRLCQPRFLSDPS